MAAQLHRTRVPLTTDGIPVPVRFSVFGLFALVALASFTPGLRLWGIDHLAYYPLWIRVAALLCVGLSLDPRIARAFHRTAVAIATRWKDRRRRVALVLTLLGFAALACLWMARSSTELLGDGRMVARSFEVIFANPAGVRLQGVMDILRNERLYPGAMMVYFGAGKLAASLPGISPVTGIRLVNCLLGALVIVTLAVLARKRSVATDAVPWTGVVVGFSGAMALFAGYVEFYPPLMFAAFLYLLSAYRCLAHNRGLTLVVILFVVSVFTHVQGILLGPSLLFVIWRRLGGSRDPRTAGRALPAILALTVLVVAAGALVPSLRSHYLAIWGTKESFGVLTPSHLLDVLNELLLVCPALPVGAALLWYARTRSRPDAGPTARAATSAGDEHASSYFGFGLLVLVPSLIYLLLFRTEIGVARDWDLFSMVALGVLPLAHLAAAGALRQGSSGDRLAPVLMPAILVSIVLGAAWIGVNASWGRSAARFERLLEFDPTHSGYARENLALLYHEKGDLARATRIMEEAVRLEGNDRHTVRLARFYAEAGRFDDAAALARGVVARDPDFVEARLTLVQILEARGAFAEMYEVAKAGTGYFPRHPGFWYYLGTSAAALARNDEARQAFQMVLSLNPGPEVQRRVAMMLGRLGPPASREN